MVFSLQELFDPRAAFAQAKKYFSTLLWVRSASVSEMFVCPAEALRHTEGSLRTEDCSHQPHVTVAA